jgi:DNA-binding transcriptional LysR family regulator
MVANLQRHMAKMHDLDWDDLRFFLVLRRARQYRLAAKSLGVNESTVIRRIERIQTQLQARLFEKAGREIILTSAGQEFAHHVERIESEVDAARRAAHGLNRRVEGKVCLTAAPMLLRHILIPLLPELLRRHPGLQLELVAEPRNLSLLDREADIALRLARPQGEPQVLAKRIAHLEYAVYSRTHDASLPWIVYGQGGSSLPHARWMASVIRREPAARVALTVNDSDLALQAIRSGVGRSLLPIRIGNEVQGLVRTSGPTPALRRELWLLMHPALKDLASVRTVAGWIEKVF